MKMVNIESDSNRIGHRRKYAAICWLGVFVLVVAVSVGLVQRKVEQTRLDRALIATVARDDTDAALALLHAGADANTREIPYESVSLWDTLAAMIGRMRGIVPPKVEPISPPLLIQAADHQNTRLVIALLDHHAVVNALNVPNTNGASTGYTALFFAVANSQLDMVRSLLEHGANPNLISGGGINWGNHNKYPGAMNGDSPLNDARDVAVLRILLEHGADVHKHADCGKYNYGVTPLMVHMGDLTAIKLLLARGADINECGNFGATPLMYAAKWFELSGLQFAVAHGANVNAEDEDGDTALMYAMQVKARWEGEQETSEAISAIKILVKAGADVNHRNHDGETAIDVARRPGMFDKSVVNLLEGESRRQLHSNGRS